MFIGLYWGPMVLTGGGTALKMLSGLLGENCPTAAKGGRVRGKGQSALEWRLQAQLCCSFAVI